MDWQYVIVVLLIAVAVIGLAVAAVKSIRSLARGKCASRCSGCASANDGTAPEEAEQAEARVVFLPAGHLRNSARDARK